MFKPQSKYPVLHQGTFGGTGFLFLGRLGSRANTEKRFWADYEQLFMVVFSCSGGQKNFFKNLKKKFSNRIEKLHKMAFINFF